MMEQPPVRLVVTAAGQPHQRGEILGAQQSVQSLCHSLRSGKTLHGKPQPAS
jgi:hypothetical protein